MISPMKPHDNDMVTELGPRNEMMETQWGPIVYDQWCEREVARCNVKGSSVSVYRDDYGNCCIVRVPEIKTKTT